MLNSVSVQVEPVPTKGRSALLAVLPRWKLIAGALLLSAVGYIALAKLVKQSVESRGDISVYYNAARDLIEGRNPFVEGWYLYPLVWAWLLIPLAKQGPLVFAVVWGGCLGVCWALSSYFIRRLFPDLRDHPRSFLLFALPHVILFRWLWNGLGHGQVTLLLLAGLLLVVLALESGYLVTSSTVLGFLGAIKIFPLYFGLVFCRPLRKLCVAMTILSAAFVAIMPCLHLGLSKYAELTHFQLFGKVEPSMQDRLLWGPNHSPVPSLVRGLGCRSTAVISGLMIPWAMLCTGTVVALSRGNASVHRRRLWISLVFVSMVVTCPIAWGHYCSFLLYPITAVLAFAISRPRADPTRKTIFGVLATVAVLLNAESGWIAGTNDFKETGLVAWALALSWVSLVVVLLRSRCEEPSGGRDYAERPVPEVGVSASSSALG